MTWPAILFWLLIFTGAYQRGPLLLYVFAVAGAFGSLQMVPGDMVGGVNLLPQSICAVFLVAKVLLSKGHMVGALNEWSRRRLGLGPDLKLVRRHPE